MPDTGPTSERLEALRERWETEPGSRVFLQLADEYRRLGRPEEAARVLEEGLESSPNHPAAQVALGRCHLDLGRPGEAASLLERVIENDPTQMVAYRLLVDAYLREGRADEARQRLRVYSLLNDADPEIAELRRRIGELDRRARPEAAADETAATHQEASEAAEDSEGPDDSEPAPAAATPETPPAEARPAAPGSDGEPFPGLADPDARRRYLGSLASGDLFAVAEPDETAAQAAPGTREGGEVFDLDEPAGASDPDLSSLLEPGEEPAPPSPPGAVPEERGRPTLTLGRLYLRQGHLREAEEIFREVLARDPDDAEARRFLEELQGSGRSGRPASAPDLQDLEAPELLAGYAGPGGLTDRKRYVLERYLDRLRGRAPGDVH